MLPQSNAETPDTRIPVPPTYPFGELVLPEGTTVVHKSGIPVHIFGGGSEALCSVTLLWPGGDGDFAPYGLTSLAMSGIREGTADRSSQEIADILDYNGARLSTAGYRHNSMARLVCACSRLESSLNAVLECAAHAAMPEKNIRVILENAAMGAELDMRQPLAVASLKCTALTFGEDHPAARILTADDIRSLDSSSLLRTQQRICRSIRGMHVLLAGYVDSSVLDALNRCLDRYAAEAGGEAMIPEFRPACPQAPGTVVSHIDGSLQSAIVAAIPAISRDNPDYQNLRTTVTALGGYFGSRLMCNIREEKGYTYGIQAVLAGETEGSNIIIRSQQDTKYTDAVIAETRHEIERLRDELLPDDELERLRNHELSEVAKVLDTPFSIAYYRMCEYTEQMPHNYYSRLRDCILSIDAETIRDMARKYIDPAALRIAIATA